jgi:hypothetical protein
MSASHMSASHVDDHRRFRLDCAAMQVSSYRDIRDSLLQLYIGDPRPWLVGYSGGKDSTMTDAALSRFETQPVDGYDLFLIEAVVRAGIVQVITDDGDYCTVPGITVFTGNQTVLTAATAQGKLRTR